jgi:hypothetical protein
MAQRAGIFARLRDAKRMGELDGEHLIARRERETEAIGLSRTAASYSDDACTGSRISGSRRRPSRRTWTRKETTGSVRRLTGRWWLERCTRFCAQLGSQRWTQSTHPSTVDSCRPGSDVVPA